MDVSLVFHWLTSPDSLMRPKLRGITTLSVVEVPASIGTNWMRTYPSRVSCWALVTGRNLPESHRDPSGPFPCQRIRIDRESGAIHDLIPWLEEPVGYWRSVSLYMQISFWGMRGSFSPYWSNIFLGRAGASSLPRSYKGGYLCHRDGQFLL